MLTSKIHFKFLDIGYWMWSICSGWCIYCALDNLVFYKSIQRNQRPERIYGVRNPNSLLYQLVNEVMLNHDNLENLDNLEPVLGGPPQEQINNAARIVRYGDGVFSCSKL